MSGHIHNTQRGFRRNLVKIAPTETFTKSSKLSFSQLFQSYCIYLSSSCKNPSDWHNIKVSSLFLHLLSNSKSSKKQRILSMW